MTRRVGFVINSRVPEVRGLAAGMLPHHLLTGWDDFGSPMSFMRFHWVAGEVNRTKGIRYELYRPWHHYDAVVFLKSMGVRCERKMEALRASGTQTVFEANVDYYSEASPANLPGDLAPTEEQRRTAIFMTTGADATIASSRRLQQICSQFSPGAAFIPDSIPPRLVPSGRPPQCVREGRLHLWWSGMAAKLYDFLLIDRALREMSGRLHIHLVTSGADHAIQRWPDEQAESFRSLLASVPHTFHPFRSVPDLMRLYHSQGGVIVSPRFLESPYNHSHTEWKLTLGLACGLAGIGSQQPSYVDAAAACGGSALRICADECAWAAALDEMLSRPRQTWEDGLSGSRPILEHYGTPRVAAMHREVLARLLA